MAPFSIASLSIFFKEDSKDIKRAENHLKFRDYAKINDFLRLFGNGMDGFA